MVAGMRGMAGCGTAPRARVAVVYIQLCPGECAHAFGADPCDTRRWRSRRGVKEKLTRKRDKRCDGDSFATPHARPSPRQQDWRIPACDRAASSSDQEHISLVSLRCFLCFRYSETVSDHKSVAPRSADVLASSKKCIHLIRVACATPFSSSAMCTHGAVSYRSST